MKRALALIAALVCASASADGPRNMNVGGQGGHLNVPLSGIALRLPLSPALADECTGASIPGVTFTRSSSAVCKKSDGTYVTLSSNQPRVEADGLRMETAATNYFLNSATPATQTITLAAGTYTGWRDGSGSMALAVGTAVATGLPCTASTTDCTFTVSTGGTVTATISGSPQWGQVESSPIRTSRITTTGASATRAAEVATVTTPQRLSRTEGCARVCFMPDWTGNAPGGVYVLVGSSNARFFYSSGDNGMSAYDGTSIPSVFAGFTAGTPKCFVTDWSAAAGTLTVTNLASSAVASSSGFTSLGAFNATVNIGSFPSGTAQANGLIRDIALGSRAGACNQVTAEARPADGTFSVIKSGAAYYMRFPFSVTNDLAIRMDLGAGGNNVSNWQSTFFVPPAASNSAVATYNADSNIVHSNGDDPAPFRYNSAVVGSNHGHTQFVTVTSAGHGKTTADIGSQWSDGNSVRWTIIKVPDANTLWLLSDYTKSGDVYTFNTAETGNLTHVSGATHTTAITVSARATGTDQLYPAVKNLAKQVLLNGTTEISSAADQTFRGISYVDVVNTYDITDLASVLDYVKTHIGSDPDFAASAIASGASVSYTYRFYPNASCTVFATLHANKQISIMDNGFIQSGALNQTGGRRLYEYIPNTLAITGATKTWNFASVEDITSGVDSVVFTPPYWADANNPPSRMVQILKGADDTPIIGWMLAYHPTTGITAPATRKNNVYDAIDMRDTKKQYPVALSYLSTNYPTGNVTAGSDFSVVAHRSYFDPAAQPNATVATYVEDGTDALLFLDYHKNVTAEAVTLPARFRGRAVSVIDKSTSVTVLSSVVGTPGIQVTVTGGYGYAVLKLAGGA